MRRLTVMMVAGEPSGDVLGARLMQALNELAGERLEIVGVGGDEMAAAGLESLFPMATLSVMGLFEVLPRVLELRRCMQAAEALIRERRPDVVVTIDSPGFNHRLIRRVQDLELLKVHYVAPSVWAYHPRRAAKVAALYDHLLTLLPFEPSYFEQEGLAATFVGHPAIEAEFSYRGDPRAFRRSHGIPPHSPLIAVLFGSRQGELRRMGPIFVDALREVARALPQAVVVAPTLPSLAGDIERLLRRLELPSRVVVGAGARMDAFHAAEGALAASGTVALELALAGVPTVVAYRLNPLTAMVARRVLKTPYVNLINILMKEAVVPELLQENCRAELIAPALLQVMGDPGVRDRQVEASRIARDMLKPGALWPSAKAARVLMNLIDDGRER